MQHNSYSNTNYMSMNVPSGMGSVSLSPPTFMLPVFPLEPASDPCSRTLPTAPIAACGVTEISSLPTITAPLDVHVIREAAAASDNCRSFVQKLAPERVHEVVGRPDCETLFRRISIVSNGPVKQPLAIDPLDSTAFQARVLDTLFSRAPSSVGTFNKSATSGRGFDPLVLALLTTYFAQTDRPSKAQQEDIQRRTGLSPRQISFWFSNHRSRRNKSTNSPDPCSPKALATPSARSRTPRLDRPTRPAMLSAANSLVTKSEMF